MMNSSGFIEWAEGMTSSVISEIPMLTPLFLVADTHGLLEQDGETNVGELGASPR